MKIYRILIVEDDRVIAKSIKQHIEAWGCSARTVRDFSDVMHEFAEFNPHLILMDIGLPFFDGYHWCSEIRKVSQVPVIFISSAADNMNIVMAVSMGGDDFIAKPFDLSVLTAKVQAMLRRTYDFSGAVHDFCDLLLETGREWKKDRARRIFGGRGCAIGVFS